MVVQKRVIGMWVWLWTHKKLASKLDAVVLVSGDGDYVPMVEYLQNMGTQVEAISFGKSTSGKLRESVDDFIDLSLNPRKYLISRGKILSDQYLFCFFNLKMLDYLCVLISLTSSFADRK